MTILINLTLLVTIFFLSANNVLAISATSSASLEAEKLVNEASSPAILNIGQSKISPASPFYFLKMLRENIEFSLASSGSVQVYRHLEFAHRRIREVKALISLKREDLTPETLEKYKYQISKIKGRAGSDEIKIESATLLAQYNSVLAHLYDSMETGEARRVTLVAIISGNEEINELHKRLSEDGKKKLIKQITLEQALACRVLVKGSDEKLFNDTVRALLKEKAQACQENFMIQFGHGKKASSS